MNVSARQLMSPDFCATVTERAGDAPGMDPTALVLEMTENIFIEDSERAMTVLADAQASSGSGSRSTTSAPATRR